MRCSLSIISIVGARPNFMKVAPILNATTRHGSDIDHLLVHTGQHYDARMSKAFFDDLGLPVPDINLGVGSGSHAEQTAKVMMAIEPVFNDYKPDWIVVVGDVNSTLACALTGKKLNLKVAHVEAGLRSGDKTMPEELNRLCTDSICDLLFTTDRIANQNLVAEGVADERICFVGNVMIDSLLAHIPAAQKTGFAAGLGLVPHTYATLTLHRPANVDDRVKLLEILDALRDGLGDLPVIFPIHPRTRQRVQSFGLSERFAAQPGDPGICLVEPLSYLEFLDLNRSAKLVLTDSGGLQEETTVLGVPCVTIRDNTERPITINEGTNQLAGTKRDGILRAVSRALSDGQGVPNRPEKWDGRTGERIVTKLLSAR